MVKRHGAGASFGLGLLLGGSVASGAVYARLSLVTPDFVRPPTGIAVGLGGVLLLTAWLLLDLVRARRSRAALDTEEGTGREPSLRRRAQERTSAVRRRSWFTAIAAAAVAVPLWVGAVNRFRGGIPDLEPVLLTAAVTALSLGAFLVAVTAPGTRRPSPGRGIQGAALGTVTVGAALALAFGAVTVLPVDATTAVPRDDLASVPGSVSGIGWTWQSPEGEHVRGAVAAGAGLVVRVGDGVFALDGRTGEELWHHRRPGADSVQLFAAADGGTVMVSFRDGAGGPLTARFTALDAHTGEVRAQTVRETGMFGHVRRFDLFEAGYVTQTTERTITGYAPDSFTEAWRFEPPEGCPLGEMAERAGMLDVAVVAYECAVEQDGPAEISVVGLDPADGSEVWRYEHETGLTGSETRSADPLPRLSVRAGADGEAVAVSWRSQDNDEKVSVVLDQADGSVLADGLREPLTRLDDESDALELQPYSGFTAEGYLASTRSPEASAEYVWHPFGNGEPLATGSLEKVDGEGPFRPGVALTDMLVTTQWPLLEDGERADGPAHIMVRGAPWGGGDGWELAVEFELAGPPTGRKSAPLLPVPGALVLVQSGATSVTGLV